MSITDRKIEAFTSPVSSLPDQPIMTAAALKAAFDSAVEELREAFNGAIDDLTALTGAGEIGSTTIEGLEGATVRAQLVALMALKIASSNVKGIRLGASGYLEYTLDGTTWATTTYPGAGDMNRIVYDTDLDGVVNDSDKLGGQTPDYYATAAELESTNGDISAMEAKDTLLTTSGTAPAFEVTDTSVTEYAEGIIRLVKFHADGTDATLKFNALDALSVYDSDGKATKVKTGQTLWVRCNGTSFFVCSGGGGISLPQTIEAGDTVVYSKTGGTITSSTSYINAGTGFAFTALKNGTYKISYAVAAGNSAYTAYAKLTKNGTDVASSEISTTNATSITKDVALNAGDVVSLAIKTGHPAGSCKAYQFIVSIAAVDLQTALNEIITVS